MNGPLVISLIPRNGQPRYTIFECTREARTEVATCSSLEEALRKVKEIRAGNHTSVKDLLDLIYG